MGKCTSSVRFSGSEDMDAVADLAIGGQRGISFQTGWARPVKRSEGDTMWLDNTERMTHHTELIQFSLKPAMKCPYKCPL